MKQIHNIYTYTKNTVCGTKHKIDGVINITHKKTLLADSKFISKQHIVNRLSASSTNAIINSQSIIKSKTQTERAKQEFIDRVANIPGVSVHTFGGKTLLEQSMRVIVKDLLGSTAHQVRLAEIQVRRTYKNIKLNLDIEEEEANENSYLTLNMNP